MVKSNRSPVHTTIESTKGGKQSRFPPVSFLQKEHLWHLLITGKTQTGKTLAVKCNDKPEKMSSLFFKNDLTFFIYHLMFFAEVLQLLEKTDK